MRIYTLRFLDKYQSYHYISVKDYEFAKYAEIKLNAQIIFYEQDVLDSFDQIDNLFSIHLENNNG